MAQTVKFAPQLRSLPYHDAGRIVTIEEVDPQGNRKQITAPNFLDWRAQNTVFARLAAIRSRQPNLTNDGQAERIETAITPVARDRAKKSALKRMSQNFFDGSIEQAVATLLGVSRSKISQ